MVGEAQEEVIDQSVPGFVPDRRRLSFRAAFDRVIDHAEVETEALIWPSTVVLRKEPRRSTISEIEVFRC
jgi:hypothetical protein